MGVIGEMKTSTKTDNLDPVWEDENFNFASDEDDFFDYVLVFKVMDTGLGPDVELGEAKVPIKLIPLDDPTVFTFSLGAKGKKSLGHIKIEAGPPQARLLRLRALLLSLDCFLEMPRDRNTW